MKHLLCEHQNTISELKADGSMSADVMQKEQSQLENELHKRMASIKVDMQELDIENLMKELELVSDTQISGFNLCKYHCHKHHFDCYLNRNMIKK